MRCRTGRDSRRNKAAPSSAPRALRPSARACIAPKAPPSKSTRTTFPAPRTHNEASAEGLREPRRRRRDNRIRQRRNSNIDMETQTTERQRLRAAARSESAAKAAATGIAFATTALLGLTCYGTIIAPQKRFKLDCLLTLRALHSYADSFADFRKETACVKNLKL